MPPLRLQSALRKIHDLLAAGAIDPGLQLARIQSMERNIGLPVRALLIVAVVYYLFLSRGLPDTPAESDPLLELERWLLTTYLGISLAASVALFFMRKVGWGLMRWVVFIVSLMDGFFLAAISAAAGGYASPVYWAFLGLLIRNAVSVPVAALQIILNLSVCGLYLAAGLIETTWLRIEAATLPPAEGDTEVFVLRAVLLVLLSACCYGVQVLYDRNLRAQEEAREHRGRQEQLHAAGRLAAAIAHQIKNPLAIINNAAFNLQNSPLHADPTAAAQLQIIREEVERSDRIITQIVGYAQLSEGKVERLDVAAAADRALVQVFPPALASGVTIERDYPSPAPSLVMQRGHLEDIFVNLFKNAREAVATGGRIRVTMAPTSGGRLVIVVEDDGPGIPPELRERVFEPYFTTKARGSGLGLAIVKHNVELYGGTARVESGLGKGARFVLEFPTKTPSLP